MFGFRTAVTLLANTAKNSVPIKGSIFGYLYKIYKKTNIAFFASLCPHGIIDLSLDRVTQNKYWKFSLKSISNIQFL
jgi:hypothetical protein